MKDRLPAVFRYQQQAQRDWRERRPYILQSDIRLVREISGCPFCKDCAAWLRPSRNTSRDGNRMPQKDYTPRKTPGSFLPGVLLESRQTIGIRTYAERER
jgi:hypothetical protein